MADARAPSPFPGMDPYLERDWESLHACLAQLIAFALNAVIRPLGLVAKAERRITIATTFEDEDPVPRSIRPDVIVVGDTPGRGLTATAAPATGYRYLIPANDPLYHYSVRVSGVGDRKLLTSIELLSPINKRGDARTDYLSKRHDLLLAGVSVTEVDLCRRGNWRSLIVERVDLPVEAATPYRYVTRRPSVTGRPGSMSLLPVTLRHPLPDLLVPLRPGQTPAAVGLQASLADARERGGIGDDVDYARPPDPPLPPEDEAWADELLRAAGRR